MNLINLIQLILSCLNNICGTETKFRDFVRLKLNIGLHLDIYRLISSKFGIMTETTEVYILVPVEGAE